MPAMMIALMVLMLDARPEGAAADDPAPRSYTSSFRRNSAASSGGVGLM